MVKRILFIGLSSVGDVIMTTPVMLSLHEKFPEAGFDIIADKRSVALYEHCPFLNELFIKDKDRFLRGAPDLLFRLWRKRYDLIVDLRTDGLAYLIRGRNRYTKWHSQPYGPHAIEELMGVIAKLHGADAIPHPQIWISKDDENYAAQQLSVFADDTKLLALSVGDPNKPVKTWPVKKFIELLNKISETFSGLVFLGAENENENTCLVTEGINMPYINVTGNSLFQAAALLKRCSLYFGPDSGLGHIASAVGTPTVSLFSQVSPVRFRPWGERASYVRGENHNAQNISVEAVEKLIRNK